ncbi:aldose 1-epimerase [Caulobacter sp. BE264]|uniref:aldose 1-epimerase n=1 Tax=Caulobacter sp. BE264 TaxID=2817724 RepID=UPI00285FD543|nr:aldose 1-epimerase [Caulobacter sp. BE264]MDR7231335.1 aldose 1-epimerase [Caulobacter sp. BE264]
MVAIEKGGACLVLAPEVGGAVAAFTVGGRHVLRPMGAGAVDALLTASFPLVPFCNRIPNGQFVSDGRTVVLPPNLQGHPHPLHGQGWRAPWTVESAEGGVAVLAFDHVPGDWPWSYRAEQAFELRETGFRVTLTVINTGEEVMPAGLGFHPYFPARPGERLTAFNDGVWLIDADVLPTVRHEGAWGPDWAAGAPVAGHALIDHCYTGWNQRAVLSAPGQPDTVITASADCAWLHIYVPPGEGYYCVEPCASRPNPFGEGETGMMALRPGERRSIWMEIATG